MAPLRFLASRLIFPVLLCLAPLHAFPQDATTENAAPTASVSAALEQLLVVLRDDDARAALIAELETLADAEPDGEIEAADEQTIPSEELRSLGRQIADYTREAMADGMRSLDTLGRQLSNAPRLFSGLSALGAGALSGIALDIAVLLVVTYGGLIVMRRLTETMRRRLGLIFATGGWVAKPVALGLELVLDFAAVLIPYALGNAVAVATLGTPGVVGLGHTLYLNAFAMVEVSIAIIRTIVSPADPTQRLITLSDLHARRVVAWSRLLIGLLVFGQMLLLPLVNTTVSYAAGRAVSVSMLLLWLFACAIAVIVARRAVARKLIRLVSGPKSRAGLRGLITGWYLFALAYLVVLAIAALTRSTAQFQALLWAHVQIALAILAGAIALNVIRRMLAAGVDLPSHVRRRAPQLQTHLAALVPALLKTLRVGIVIAVIIFCLHRLGLFNVFELLETEYGARVAGATITVSLMLLFAALAWIALNTWVDAAISAERSSAVSARKRTLYSLLRNAATIALIVLTLMFILSEIGINIAPLLASAGVIGLAIGFGAQKLVQDIITGIFIQLEGAIDVGDVVSIGGISGVVERLTIRSASLRDGEGSYHVIPFSSVSTVTNFMRGFSYAVIDATVGYKEKTEEARRAMLDAFAELRIDPDHKLSILGDFDWQGIERFSPAETVLRARIKTLPGKQWGVKRAYFAILKRLFVERGIEVPSTQQNFFFGADIFDKAIPLSRREEETPGESEEKGQTNT